MNWVRDEGIALRLGGEIGPGGLHGDFAARPVDFKRSASGNAAELSALTHTHEGSKRLLRPSQCCI
jgi:hypothetical protein